MAKKVKTQLEYIEEMKKGFVGTLNGIYEASETTAKAYKTNMIPLSVLKLLIDETVKKFETNFDQAAKILKDGLQNQEAQK